MSLSENLVSFAKALFNHKSDANGHNLASQSKAGFMSPLDKAKLDNISGEDFVLEDGAVTTEKIADSAVTLAKINAPFVGATAYVDGTSGLVPASKVAEKDKFLRGDGTWQTVAAEYTLPTATSSVLGGVKVGSNISVSSGTISLSKDNIVSALGYTPISSVSASDLADTSITMNKLVNDLDCGEI